MASAISHAPEDRQSLSTYRTMGSTVAGVIIGVGVPLFAYDTVTVGGVVSAVMNGPRFTLIAGAFSALAAVSYLLCYFLSTERVVTESVEGTRRGFLSLFGDALRNRALISIIVASVLMLFSQLTMQKMANYLFPDYYGTTAAQSASTLAMLGSMTVSAAVAKPLSQRLGKAELGAISSLFAAVVSIILYILKPDNVWIYVLISLAMWFGLGIFSMVSWALITDVIDDSEVRVGVREDGSIYALYSFARKLGQALSAGLTGALLSAIGYSDKTAFDENVLRGIYDISTLVPALGFLLLTLILWFWYPLHKKRVEENVEALKKKHLFTDFD
jgi:GPH family glycoside/pentoside/hexuronide:cation symporter